MFLSHPDILDGLNEAQKQAVMTTEGPVLIVAGPGAGKTLTIVRRIAYLVSRGVPPDNILAVTFTNRAAREMKERTAALLGEGASRIFTGTFHLLGLRIIRENRSGDFSILDREEQTEILKSILKGPAKAIQQAAERISRIKNYLAEDGDLRQVPEAYQAALEQHNTYDLDDLIRVPIELLQDDAAADKYRQRFKYIIVDEYQDINPAQYMLLRLLTGATRNVCAVGDGDQAIYSFRGANIQNFLDFEKDFPNATRVTLTQNYRSTGRILEAAGSVIRNNHTRIEKDVLPTRGQGLPVSVVSVCDDRAEGAEIISRIEASIGGTSHSQIRQMDAAEKAEDSSRFSDFAVIYRTNAQAKALENAFAASGIPYQVIGKRSSMQRKEIEETLRFLHALADPAEQPRDPHKRPEEKLMSEADFFDPRAEAVTLMTMHGAKGLEFRTVFIAGCEAGLTPCTVINDDPDIEEERRLFYVGMTRAREKLFLIHARKRFLYGQSLGQKHSPFLDEIPDGLKDKISVADKMKKQKPEEKQMGLF